MSESAEIPQFHSLPELQKQSEPRMLSLEKYRERRSATLLNNPDAQLDQQHEVLSYLAKQEPQYRERITQLAQLDLPMNSDCRAVIMIPAYNEGSRIKQTLEQYALQTIDRSAFEIVIFSTPAENDTTESEVDAFREEHPDITVILASEPWAPHEPRTVGNARKYAGDIALARSEHREHDKDIIFITNDADTVSIQPDYLKKILQKFDTDASLDGLVTSIDIPQEAMNKPNIAASYKALTTFEELYATGDVGVLDEDMREPALTNGRSTAVRSAIYAAVGGYNPNAVITEDWELGWMMADAREWDATRIQFDKETHIITDPRRFLDTTIQRVPVDQQLLDFDIKPEVRSLNNTQLLERIPDDTFDWELFEDDIASMWRSQFSGANARIGRERFELLFRAAMERLGVTYHLVGEAGDEHAVLDDVNLQRLTGLSRNIQIVHSPPKEYTPDLISKLRSSFADLPRGVIASRKAKAEKIATEIMEQQSQDKVIELKKQYKRFAGYEYDEAAA